MSGQFRRASHPACRWSPDRQAVRDGSSTPHASMVRFRLLSAAGAYFPGPLAWGEARHLSGVLAVRVLSVREVWLPHGCWSCRPTPTPLCDLAGPFAAAFPNGGSAIWNGGKTGVPLRAWRACRDSRSVLPPCSLLAILCPPWFASAVGLIDAPNVAVRCRSVTQSTSTFSHI